MPKGRGTNSSSNTYNTPGINLTHDEPAHGHHRRHGHRGGGQLRLRRVVRQTTSRRGVGRLAIQVQSSPKESTLQMEGNNKRILL